MARDAGADSRTGRAPTAVDAAIALTMGVYAVLLPTAMTHKGLIWQDVVVTVVCVLALWQLRRWPYAAMAVICAATTLSFAMGWDGNLSPMAFTYAVIVFAVGSMSTQTLITALMATLLFLTVAAMPWFRDVAGGERADLVLRVWIVFTVALGVRAWRMTRLAHTERDRRVEEVGEEALLRRVAEERVQIARELHDVIAHHVALVGVQAAVAQQKVRRHDDEGAHDALEQVRRSTKTVLTELQDLLGALRSDGEGLPDRPVPGLRDVPALVQSFDGTGTDVDVHLPDPFPAVPTAADVAAFRLVQEALTNVQKHAPGSTAVVDVAAYAGSIDVTVTNGPPAATPATDPDAPGGLGLQGMRERIRALGGGLHCGPTAAGGFSVSATIPFAREVP